MLEAARVQRALRSIRRGATPSWRVSTGRARAHVAELRAAGWTFERIGKAAGIAPASVYRLTRRRRCSNLVSDAVLSVMP
jgi:hypothetical protein